MATTAKPTGKMICCSFCRKPQDEVLRLIAGADHEIDGVKFSPFICDECVELANDIVREEIAKMSRQNAPQDPYPSVSSIIAELDKHVVAQSVAKTALAIAMWAHARRSRLKPSKDGVVVEKQNILMIGPTGVGKTLLAQTLSRMLDMPMVIADATTLTEAGYVGDDVETVLQKLLAKVDWDVEKAKHGIVFIDEIDKIGRRSGETSATRDVSGEGVQQALLKMLEGKIASVPVSGKHKRASGESIELDTTEILFICAGAFSGIDRVIEQRLGAGSIGFTAEVKSKRKESASELILKATPEDLMRFGMIPEFIGRLPVLVKLHDLDEAALMRVLREPVNSPLRQAAKEMRDLVGIELVFDDAALSAIAREAIKRKSGARGLTSIIANALTEAKLLCYDDARNEGVDAIRITEDVVIKNALPLVVRKKKTEH
ncbi:MAG TPA: ATP-dependent Clp protease ATP-binding subunit ClpX [Candidatus Paceibacterota bacterium]|nr:ATP-dependent Clp protease ATP-binding subunit ClpX [Candidatus Paceibacterota bacterium]